MTMTSVPPDEAETAAQARHEAVVALTDLAVYLETHPDAPLPVLHMNIPVPGGTHDERMGHLRTIGDEYGVPVIQVDGTLIATRRIGPLTVEAHITAPDLSARIARRQDAAMATEAAA